MMIQKSATNTSNLYDVNQDHNHVLLDLVGLVLIPVIVCGNILIIVAVCRFKKLRYCSNIMIVSLAVGDLMMGILYMPMKLLLFHSKSRGLFTQRLPCLLNIFSGYFSVTTAMFFLAMLSIERFYAVQFPFHYHSNMTITRSVLWSIITMAVAFSITVPIICGIDSWIPDNVCFGSDILPRFYILSVVSVVFLVSLMGFLCFWRVLFAEIRSRMQDQKRVEPDSRRHDPVKSTLMLTVYVFSIICWIPQLVYLFIGMFRPESTNLFGLRSVSLLGVCSSGVNCFIYGIKNSKFREAFKSMFNCKTPQVQPVPSTRESTQRSIF